MAWYRVKLKRKVGAALNAAMEPGDQIVAGTLAQTGRGQGREAACSGALAFSGVALWALGRLFSPSIPGHIGTMLGLAGFAAGLLALRHRPLSLAVTKSQIICYRLSRLTKKPVKVLFRMPLAEARIAGKWVGLGCTEAVIYGEPAVKTKGMRFAVTGLWGRDFAEVVTNLQAAGAVVDNYPAMLGRRVLAKRVPLEIGFRP
jgi:hypothetical protein